jgi:hypothetical protein
MADNDIFEVEEATTERGSAELQPLFQIYEESKIAVSKSVGKMWKQKFDAAVAAYSEINKVWQTVFQYYNFYHTKSISTPRGIFQRGDSTENIIFSNLNIMLPAIYSKDPDITCTTNDVQDEPFCKCIEAVINALFKKRNSLNAKPKIKKAAGFGLLCNYGIFKLAFTQKDDSREMAVQEMTRITDEMATVKDSKKVEELYGQLEALEENLEVLEPSGPSMSNIMPQNLIIDPYAEQSDGTDAKWMIERVYLPTASIIARFTKEDPEEDSDRKDAARVLIYKPTHKANFKVGGSREDDSVGPILDSFSGDPDIPEDYEEAERRSYREMYFTECYYVWDKVTRRIFLFHRDDWTWPLWVWDDPYKLTRFFPYFIIGYSFSTGATVSPGETAYILDHQDELNDMNRQKARIRRSVFDFFFFNTDAASSNRAEVEQFLEAIRSNSPTQKHIVGVAAGEKKVSEMIEAFVPPSAQYEPLFMKEPVLEAVNRITNTSDALRGVQFKTNTNVASVTSYQESMRLSVGAKVDVIEDAVADLAVALAELCVQFMDQLQIEGLVGPKHAAAWTNMTVPEFNANYSLELIAGSMEKPNSVFKKKEAIEVAQAVGQFARAAPGAVMRIMLRVLEQAFTEVVIKPEDWAMLDQEVQANLMKGQSVGGQPPVEGEDLASQLSPEDKQQIVQMRQQGASDDQLAAFVQERIAGANNAQAEPDR